MNIIPADTYEYSQRLWKVLKTNHGLELANRIIHELFDNDNFGVLEEENIDISQEFQRYREKRAKVNYEITQLTLPARFKMLKTPTNRPRTTNIELEEPESQLDSSSSELDSSTSHLNPDHKRRPIFPLD